MRSIEHFAETFNEEIRTAYVILRHQISVNSNRGVA